MTDNSDNGFLRHFCDFTPQIMMLLAVCGVFLVLSLGSLLVVSPGTSAYVITMLNVVGLTAFSMLFGGMLLLCRRYKQNSR